MILNDFIKEDNHYSWTSKEKFLFENNKVKFWYKLYLTTYTYQPGWDNRYETKYQVLLVVDDESIHPNHDTGNIKEYRFGYFLKEAVICGEFNESGMEKILNSQVQHKTAIHNRKQFL